MLGPLPAIYRVIVSAIALLAFVGCGAWLTSLLPGPFLALAGAGIGAGIGAVVVLLLLHDFEHPHGQAHRVRIRSHRQH